MDVSFGNPWDWARDRALSGNQGGSDLSPGDGILGSVPSDAAAVPRQGGILPDTGGANLGQARFADPQPMGQPYA